jgi:replicative DNA helicase
MEGLIQSTFDTIERLHERKEAVTGVPTGYRKLDELTAGLQPSDLIIVAGRPSMGKTAFCMNIAEHAALKAKAGVAIFSLEMSKEQLAMRMLCSQALVDLKRVRTGHLSNEEFDKLAHAASDLSNANIFIDDTPAITVLELRAKARRLARDPGADLRLVVIDYLQLMRSSEGKDSREQEISEISRSLKALAKELNVPIVALSQLNRQVENRHPPKPRLADLRESGAIEQDADVIAFIYREEVYDEETPRKGLADIIVAKQRNGPLGDVELTFLRESTRFIDSELVPDESFPGPGVRDRMPFGGA